jgi:hypothetical protein
VKGGQIFADIPERLFAAARMNVPDFRSWRAL